MHILSLSAIATGLAMDAFAVSVTSGIAIKQMHLRHALRIAVTFGLFQAIMPVIGWLLANFAADYIMSYNHWIAFTLLSVIGLKMIYEAKYNTEAEQESNPLNIYILFALAIATSLDALVVGVTFSLLHYNILFPVIVIGAITFFFSLTGVYLGQKYGHIFDASKVEILGGVVLIVIGIKILVEHLV